MSKTISKALAAISIGLCLIVEAQSRGNDCRSATRSLRCSDCQVPPEGCDDDADWCQFEPNCEIAYVKKACPEFCQSCNGTKYPNPPSPPPTTPAPPTVDDIDLQSNRLRFKRVTVLVADVCCRKVRVWPHPDQENKGAHSQWPTMFGNYKEITNDTLFGDSSYYKQIGGLHRIVQCIPQKGKKPVWMIVKTLEEARECRGFAYSRPAGDICLEDTAQLWKYWVPGDDPYWQMANSTLDVQCILQP